MKRIALIVIRVILRLPYWWGYKVNKYKHIENYPLEERYGFIHGVVSTISRKARVELKCYGLENLPKQSGYLLAPNHQGLYDPLAIFQTHEAPIRAIVKKELTSVILVKDVLKMLEFVPMDRSNVRGSAKIIKYVANECLNICGVIFLSIPANFVYFFSISLIDCSVYLFPRLFTKKYPLFLIASEFCS